jgi:SAM-dependent methyltransferase
MHTEFGTFAGWTREAAESLGERYAVPAACRGSGTPAALQWMLERLRVGPGEVLLDVGAGLGGPAAVAVAGRAVRAVCLEPEPEACLAASSMLGLAAARATADRIPLCDNAADAIWSLGTLCTTNDKARWLQEWRRVLRPRGALALLVLVSTSEPFSVDTGNAFPSEEELERLLRVAGFSVSDRCWTDSLPPAEDDWQELERAVDEEIERRHGHDPRLRRVREQEARLGRLLDEDRIRGLLVVGGPATAGEVPQPVRR